MKVRVIKEEKDKVGKKISKLKDEGYPHKQAAAIALDMEQEGRLEEATTSGIDRQAVANDLKGLGFSEIKFLGEGQIGVVFSAITPDFKDCAVKALKKGPNQTNREIENYINVGKIRHKSNKIKKHFPKVYGVLGNASPEFAYIIMERLTMGPAAQWAQELFAGFEAAPQVRPDEKLKDRDPKRSISKRVETMLIQDLSGEDRDTVRRNGMLGVGFLSQLSHLFTPEEANDLLQRAQLLRNWLNSSKLANFSALKGQLSGSKKFIETLESDLKDTPNVVNFLAAYAQMIMKFYKEKKQKELENTKDPKHKFALKRRQEYQWEDFKMSMGQAGKALINWVRKSSPVPVKYDPTGMERDWKGADPEIGKEVPGAKSIIEAIEELYNVFGIWPKDMHIGNVMQRENGDIVIVDLGLFSKVTAPMPRGPSMDWDAPTVTMTETKMKKIKVFIGKR